MKHTVFVSGVSGYLASWIVACLLRDGHTVQGTVRCLDDAAKLRHLHNLARIHPGRLELFEADLSEAGSFDKAMQGCSVVIHTASPRFPARPGNVQDALLQPALEGMLNVLGSVKRTPTVRRVVLTSSIGTLYTDARELTGVPDCMVREDGCNTNRDPRYDSHVYAKMVAERAARKAQRQQRHWDLVTMHPGVMFGPALSRRTDTASVRIMLRFLRGMFRIGVPQLTLGFVDVRDAAEAHVRAALLPHAGGRYIVVGEALRMLEMAKLMRVKAFGLKDRRPRREMSRLAASFLAPLYGLQRKYVLRNAGHLVRYDNVRSRNELGLVYRSPAETLHDHISQLVADDLL